MPSPLRTVSRDLDWFLSRLRSKEHFSFSRWGDGEWRAILGRKTGFNCDGHYYTAALAQDLMTVLRSKPDYALGMQRLAMRLWGEKIEDWLVESDLQKLEWSNCDVFHRAAINGRMRDMVGTMKNRDVILVGPKHLSGIGKKSFKPRGHVVVPDRVAHEARLSIVRETREMMDRIKNSVVSVCAGMTAEIIVHDLHQTHGLQHTIIDFGSLWDPLVGVNSRSYMRNKS